MMRTRIGAPKEEGRDCGRESDRGSKDVTILSTRNLGQRLQAAECGGALCVKNRAAGLQGWCCYGISLCR